MLYEEICHYTLFVKQISNTFLYTVTYGKRQWAQDNSLRWAVHGASESEDIKVFDYDEQILPQEIQTLLEEKPTW